LVSRVQGDVPVEFKTICGDYAAGSMTVPASRHGPSRGSAASPARAQPVIG
jgi:hypothetical protein